MSINRQTEIMEYWRVNGVIDYYKEFALNEDENAFSVYKFGRVTTTSGQRIPMWDGNTNYIFPDTADTITVTSDDPNDAPGGTGARSVRIFGLDANWEMQDEIINLGETTTNTYIRLFRMRVVESGTNDFPFVAADIANNIGTITATHNGTASPIAIIQPRQGQTLMAIYTIPEGYTALMWAADTNNGRNNDAVGFVYTKKNNGITNPWLCKGIRDMYRNSVGKAWRIPRVYEAKTDIVIAIEGNNGDTVSGTFELELIKN